jgi:glutamine amidotransferase
MIAIIDLDTGNLGSMQNMIKKINMNAIITSRADEIEKADKLIFPGVGAFDSSIENLSNSDLLPVLEQKVLSKRTPILGVCLGMQLFTLESEEGQKAGLGWINATTVKFEVRGGDNALKIPHMGWNTLKVRRKNQLLDNISDNSRYYFVHSYYVRCNNEEDVLAVANYGYDFTAVIQKDNIYGVQFHPEKSHKFGMQILKNFLELS